MFNFHITNKVIKKNNTISKKSNRKGEGAMRKERDITIKVIENNKINIHRLAEFFARKYSEKNIKKS
mgnify:CR=1 FL=1